MKDMYNEAIDADLTYLFENISAGSSNSYIISLHRQVSADDLYNIDLDMMPGFRLTWNYNKHIEPVADYSSLTLTKQFVRLVNMMDKVQNDQENVWKIVKQTRKIFLSQLMKDLKC